MTNKQKDYLKKFKKLTGWMCEDLKRSMFCARANFLVAMGLFNYIEIIGAFMTGYFEKDDNGNIRKDKNGKKIKSKSITRFKKFFAYLGKEYQSLLKKYNKIYDYLRCGLTHEYLPKKRKFCVYGTDRCMSEKEMDNLLNNIDKSRVICGVVYLKEYKMWQIFNPKLFIDFKRGINNFIDEVKKTKNKKLLNNFFETAREINLENFG